MRFIFDQSVFTGYRDPADDGTRFNYYLAAALTVVFGT